jgi:hypothetical protein
MVSLGSQASKFEQFFLRKLLAWPYQVSLVYIDGAHKVWCMFLNPPKRRELFTEYVQI